MLKYFKKLFTSEKSSANLSYQPDIPAVIAEVEANEQKEIPTGKRIHTLEYGNQEIRLDRDITNNYRVTIYEGTERRFSFTVFAKQGEYQVLEKAYEDIISYLSSDRHPSELPEKEYIKGFFYGL